MSKIINKNFPEDLKEARKIELLVSNYLVDTDWGELEEDLSLKKKDIYKGDFKFWHNFDEEYVEVKSDRTVHRWGNLYVEYCMMRWIDFKYQPCKGWIFKAEYQYLMFYDRDDYKLYILDYPKMKEWLKKNDKSLKCKTTPKYEQDELYWCHGRLLPVDKAISNGFCEVFDVDKSYNNKFLN